MLTRLHRVFSFCVLLVFTCSCAGRSAGARGPLGPVKPSSLEEYIRATYRIGTENAASDSRKNAEAQNDPALAALLSRVNTTPQDNAAKMELAELYFQRQLYRQAYDLLMDLHSTSPENQETNLRLAHIWDTWEQYGLALQHAARAFDAGADSAEAYALMARIHLHLDKADTAIAWYRKSLEKDSGNASVLANLGYAHILQSRWAEARQYLELALAIDHAMPEAHNNLAAILAMAGDYQGALGHLRKAATADVAMNNLGVLYLQHNKNEEAQYYFREALRLNPSYMTAERNLQTAQRMTPPPGIVELPRFDKIPVEERFNAFLGPATDGPDAGPAASHSLQAAASSPRAQGGSEEALSPGLSDADADEPSWTASAKDGIDGVVKSSPASGQEPASDGGGHRFGTSRSVWTTLQQKRVGNLAGFAGLILLTGLLAFRARKSWN